MSPQPEQQAREQIDALLTQAGWHVCDTKNANIHGHRGLAIREFPLKSGHGFADYLLYIDGHAAGVIEAKKEGMTLSGVEIQAAKYTQGLPDGLPRWHNPLPFAYQSTGVESRFTNGLDPDPRARPVFAFHRPDTLAELLNVAWVERSEAREAVAEATPIYASGPVLFQVGRGNHVEQLLQSIPAISKQTFGFFHRNLVMKFNYEMAVANGANDNYGVYR